MADLPGHSGAKNISNISRKINTIAGLDISIVRGARSIRQKQPCGVDASCG